MSRLYVECTIYDMKTTRVSGRYLKQFDFQDDFNKWYELTKEHGDTVINIMSYNPEEKPSLKAVNDVTLLNVSRRMPV